jgi:hypothetical protein
MGEGEETNGSKLGGAAAAWRRDRFRFPLFFFILQTAPLPFVNFLPLAKNFLAYIYR